MSLFVAGCVLDVRGGAGLETRGVQCKRDKRLVHRVPRFGVSRWGEEEELGSC